MSIKRIKYLLDTVFSGNLNAFENAATGTYDFTQLEDFGEILNHNIHSWFADEANLDLWKNLQNEFTFEERKEEITMTKDNKQACHFLMQLSHFIIPKHIRLCRIQKTRSRQSPQDI